MEELIGNIEKYVFGVFDLLSKPEGWVALAICVMVVVVFYAGDALMDKFLGAVFRILENIAKKK